MISIMELKNNLEVAFTPRDFQFMWFTLNAKYEALAFKDDISDSIRIQEYKYIVQQFRKFISSQHDAFMECVSADEMLQLIDSILVNAAEYGKERKEIAYNFVRDDWLYELQNYIMQVMYDNGIGEEEEDE